MPRLSQKDQEQYFKKKDPVLGKVIDAVQLKPLRRGRGRKKATDYFEVLTYSIISQQISTKAAATITERFRGLFPEEKPTPERVAQLTPAKLRTVGVSGQKASYIKDLSAHVLDGRLDLEVLPKLPDEEVIEMF